MSSLIRVIQLSQVEFKELKGDKGSKMELKANTAVKREQRLLADYVERCGINKVKCFVRAIELLALVLKHTPLEN